MSHQERILDFLAQFPGSDDDSLAEALGIHPRQTVNQICRRLAAAGRVTRKTGASGKIVSTLNPGYSPRPSVDITRTEPAPPPNQPTSEWFWEGNIVDALAQELLGRGWTIVFQACTHSRQRGPDIEAVKGERLLIVEAKGYPSASYRDPRRTGQLKRTNPAVQAPHWFAQALHAAMRIRNTRPDASVAVAFPQIARYQKLLNEIEGSLRDLCISSLLISEEGSIVVYGDFEL